MDFLRQFLVRIPDFSVPEAKAVTKLGLAFDYFAFHQRSFKLTDMEQENLNSDVCREKVYQFLKYF